MAEYIEMPTPYAIVKIRIESDDVWAKDEIIEWIFNSCNLPTEKEKQRFNDKCDTICKKLKVMFNG